MRTGHCRLQQQNTLTARVPLWWAALAFAVGAVATAMVVNFIGSGTQPRHFEPAYPSARPPGGDGTGAIVYNGQGVHQGKATHWALGGVSAPQLPGPPQLKPGDQLLDPCTSSAPALGVLNRHSTACLASAMKGQVDKPFERPHLGHTVLRWVGDIVWSDADWRNAQSAEASKIANNIANKSIESSDRGIKSVKFPVWGVPWSVAERLAVAPTLQTLGSKPLCDQRVMRCGHVPELKLELELDNDRRQQSQMAASPDWQALHAATDLLDFEQALAAVETPLKPTPHDAAA